MRKCMFCDGRASTLEDVWPGWLLRKLPPARTIEVTAERRGKLLPSWRAVSPAIKVRFLCASCNNGWLSRLESQAKPVIEPFLADSSLELPREQQATFALWAVKTAMAAEALGPRESWF